MPPVKREKKRTVQVGIRSRRDRPVQEGLDCFVRCFCIDGNKATHLRFEFPPKSIVFLLVEVQLGPFTNQCKEVELSCPEVGMWLGFYGIQLCTSNRRSESSGAEIASQQCGCEFRDETDHSAEKVVILIAGVQRCNRSLPSIAPLLNVHNYCPLPWL